MRGQFTEIQDLVLGETIQGFFLLKTFEVRTTQYNKKYLDLLLGDQTGDSEARMWDCTENEINNLRAGDAVKIEAKVTEWNDKLQLNISKIRKITSEDPVSIEDLVAAAPLRPEEMMIIIDRYIGKIKDGDIRNLVSKISDMKKKKLLYYPAAQKNHHSIRSGLLYHIITMLTMGEKIAEIYTFLNTDLLFAGIILHDIAKVDEMEANNLGIVADYTREGQLLGHIIQGIKLIETVAQELDIDEEKALLLQHMILAHHNEPEFGSPKRPMFPEAEVLSHLDLLDARMYDMRKYLEGVPVGGFSERAWVLNNRKVYQHEMAGD